MVATRKRKCNATPPEDKKVKADKQENEHCPQDTPTKDEHAAAAEALKALRKGGDVVIDDVVQGGLKYITTSKSCGGDGDTETESSLNSAQKQSHSPQSSGQGYVVLKETRITVDQVLSSKAGLPSKCTVAKKSEFGGKSASPSRTCSSSAASATSNSPVLTAAANSEDKGEIPLLYVGRVIGKGGEMIRDLQARSGCRIDVDQNVPEGAPRIIIYRGTRSTINFAKKLVSLLCSHEGKDTDLPLGQAVMKKVQVPGSVIGKIIGRGGDMIRKLQSESQAKIQIDHSAGVDTNHREVTLTGMNESVTKAEEMIMFLCANPAADSLQALHMLIRDKAQRGRAWGSGSPHPNFPNQGQGMQSDETICDVYRPAPQRQQSVVSGNSFRQEVDIRQGPCRGSVRSAPNETDLFPCSKMYMGRVIGQKGITINDLQKRSGCDIQINQKVPPGQDCQITITGPRHGIDTVKRMFQDIIDLGPNHPYAGGHGQFNTHHSGCHAEQQQQPYQWVNHVDQGHSQDFSHRHFDSSQHTFMGQSSSTFQSLHSEHYRAHTGVYTSPWRAASSSDGQIYYYNQITQESQWERPLGMP